ncbi:MAG: hypothetical protein RLZZ187_1272 [Pseudomonadota bacterium]|jgi:uncharacterized protein (TIGR00645 family)
MLSLLDKIMLASRWLLVAFFLGLVIALGIYALHFLGKLWKFATSALTTSDVTVLIQLLHLLDAALIASLVIMVAIASYDSLVSRLTTDEEERRTSWVALVDPGNLKIKLGTALVAISSIHLLQIFMEIGEYSDRDVTWALVIHTSFLAGILVLGVLDKLKK